MNGIDPVMKNEENRSMPQKEIASCGKGSMYRRIRRRKGSREAYKSGVGGLRELNEKTNDALLRTR